MALREELCVLWGHLVLLFPLWNSIANKLNNKSTCFPILFKIFCISEGSQAKANFLCQLLITGDWKTIHGGLLLESSDSVKFLQSDSHKFQVIISSYSVENH